MQNNNEAINNFENEDFPKPLVLISNYTDKLKDETEELMKLLNIKSSDEIKEINRFFNDLNFLTYSGKWTSKNNKAIFENTTTGEMIFKMEKLERAVESQTNLFGLKLLKGMYIDEWISFKGYSRSYSNITINENSVNMYYSSFLESGEIFDRTNEIPFCTGEFSMNFTRKNLLKLSEEEKYKYSSLLDTSSSISFSTNKNNEFIDSIKGTFKSSCEIDINFELEFSDEREIFKQITIYSIILSIFVSLQILNNIHLVNKIGESVTISNSVNMQFIFKSN